MFAYEDKYVLLLFGLAVILRFSAAAELECIRDYHRLEMELVNNDLNLDSLTRSFFPPNTPSVPVVEVFYTISNSSDPHPLILEIGGDLNEIGLAVLANYRYRWSVTPIYLFLDPNVLERLALFAIRIRSNPARLVISRPMCNNYTLNGVPLPEYHLNQLTSLLKTYALKRESVIRDGLDTDASGLQGYVSFFNDSDFRVIGSNTNYTTNLFLLIFGLIALATFITIATPLLINAQYETLYNLASEEHTNAVFVIWATAIICFMTTIGILAVDVYFLYIERLMMPNVPARWIYYLAITLTVVFLLFDLLLVLGIKKKKDFPMPHVLIIVFCQSYIRNTILAQTLAMWSAIVFMQLASFHLTFIFLAFVAATVQTGSTLLLFITGLLSAISLTTLFLAAFQKRKALVETQRKYLVRSYLLKVLYLILFICILMFTIFFSTCFIRITIYVGDIQSGGIPSLIATLAPSALLAGMGFLGKRVLEKYVPRDDKNSSKYSSMENVESDSVTEGTDKASHSEQSLTRRHRVEDKTQDEHMV